MNKLGPISRGDLVRKLKRLGFGGPYSGGKHEFMIRGGRRVPIPNPQGRDIGPAFLKRILDEADVLRDEWESVS